MKGSFRKLASIGWRGIKLTLTATLIAMVAISFFFDVSVDVRSRDKMPRARTVGLYQGVLELHWSAPFAWEPSANEIVSNRLGRWYVDGVGIFPRGTRPGWRSSSGNSNQPSWRNGGGFGFSKPMTQAALPFGGGASFENHYIGIPVWALVVLVGAIPAYRAYQRRRKRRQIAAGYCGHCDYDLRSSRKFGRCPECGEAISPAVPGSHVQ